MRTWQRFLGATATLVIAGLWSETQAVGFTGPTFKAYQFSHVVELASTSSTHNVQKVQIYLIDPTSGKQAETTLVLDVSWMFQGNNGPFFLDANVVDPASGNVVSPGLTKLLGDSGIAETQKGDVKLLFSNVYKISDHANRAYFKTGKADIKLWWSKIGAKSGQTSPLEVVLSPAWLASAKRILPTKQHPDGGISISTPTPPSQSLLFYVQFSPDGGSNLQTLGTE